METNGSKELRLCLPTISIVLSHMSPIVWNGQKQHTLVSIQHPLLSRGMKVMPHGIGTLPTTIDTAIQLYN